MKEQSRLGARQDGASELQLSLAAAIRTDLRLSGAQPGDHLAEIAIAGRFTASRATVRRALDLLVAEGLAEKRPNRGYFVARRDDGAPPAESLSAEDGLYRRMSSDWLARRVKPIVRESELRDRYGIGREPLLRVLVRMCHDQVIAPAGRGRWRLLPTIDTEQSSIESYAFRIVVEPAAIRLDSFVLVQPAANRLAETLQNLLALPPEDLPLDRFLQTDHDFHALVAQSSGNAFFQTAIESQNQLRRLSERDYPWTAEEAQASMREHLDILTALIAGDREQAAGLMEQHLAAAAPICRKVDRQA